MVVVDEEALIRRYIGAGWYGEPYVIYERGGPSVWAITGRFGAVASWRGVAEDYEIPLDAVRAVLALYRRHPEQMVWRCLSHSGSTDLDEQDAVARDLHAALERAAHEALDVAEDDGSAG